MTVLGFHIDDKGAELDAFGLAIREVRHNAMACLTRLQNSFDKTGNEYTGLLIDRVLDHMDANNIPL